MTNDGTVDVNRISSLILKRELGAGVRERYKRIADLKRTIIDHRVSTIEACKFKGVPFSSQNAVGISAMAFDEAEQRFLLCGSSRGNVSIIDFESQPSAELNAGVDKRFLRVIPARGIKDSHKFLVTSCQFYPVDSGVFASSSQDKTVKLWDSSTMTVVDQHAFEAPVSQFHWGVNSSTNSSLIAVSISSSNVHLVDPRMGSSFHQIRCKGAVSAVNWQRASNFILMTGDISGRIFLWDIRSGRSELAELNSAKSKSRDPRKSAPEKAHQSQITCIKGTDDGRSIMSMSLNRVLHLWNGHTLKPMSVVKDPGYECDRVNKPVLFEFSDEGRILWTFIPRGNDVCIQGLNGLGNSQLTKRRYLQGHFHSVTAVAYRRYHQELVSSANDRLVLIWVPQMDEERPEDDVRKEVELHKDDYSDDD